ncbi:ABC transporter substrate-binding protein [Martelella alba]|uniref:Sugar ABC transporter substrate-binding protein n=1 Tax=Martelella alba TaxID=2590451 RepID=A0ABY2SGR5_9HYPH|nr:substrate-binding domain-containing protein [Martelella alba]TKI04384.1 sugar ABC transporter substrate-binding protein [Martelella alba]
MLFNTGRKFLITLTCSLTAMTLFTGVSRAAEAPPTYALVQINQQALFFNLMNKGAQAAAKESGKSLVIFNANDNPVAQNDAIENYIQQGVKGIMVDAIDVNGIMPAIKEAADAHIPVIAIDAVLPAGPQKAQVGVNNIKGGQILGHFFNDYVKKNMGGKAKIGIVGALNSAIQNQRQKGFEDVIKTHSGIKVVDVVDGRNIQDDALTAAENLITGNPDMTAIYATGEPALLGAMAAVVNQGRQKDIKIFGWDLTAQAITGIDQGYVVAVLQQDPEKMGSEALKALNAVNAGKTVEKNILVPATVVTKSNVDTFRPLFK